MILEGKLHKLYYACVPAFRLQVPVAQVLPRILGNMSSRTHLKQSLTCSKTFLNKDKFLSQYYKCFDSFLAMLLAGFSFGGFNCKS